MDVFHASIILTLLSIGPLIYWYLSRGLNHWSKRGIKGPRPIPIFGNLLDFFIIPQPIQELKWFKNYGKIYGHFMGKTPVLTISDPKLIKNVLVKDFHLFPDRSKFTQTNDPIMSKILTQLTGDDWKRVRSIVSPTFTSGKMKNMYPRIKECLNDFMNHLETFALKREEINVKDMYGNYTMDVIATCAFATKTDVRSLDNPFVVNARIAFNTNPIRRIATLMVPSVLHKVLGLSTSGSREFFIGSIRQIMANRTKNEGKKYNDFLQLLIDVEKQHDIIRDDNDNLDSHHVNEGEEELSVERKALNINIVNKHLTDNEVMAQALVFMLAGYETTGTLLSFCTYELALNPHIQDILCKEVNSVIDSNGEIIYEELAKLPYLDSVISETLRLHSPAQRIARLATTDYPLGDTGITLKAGQQIDFPIYAIHTSEEYYPNPFQFNPDRFMPENRHNIIPYTYLPFGAGPRNCIGMRFALLEAKLALAHIVTKYKFLQTPNTDVPIMYKRSFGLTAPQRLIVGIEKRL